MRPPYVAHAVYLDATSYMQLTVINLTEPRHSYVALVLAHQSISLVKFFHNSGKSTCKRHVVVLYDSSYVVYVYHCNAYIQS